MIQSDSRHALKEWAVVVAALASGRQTILIRKGGILEGRTGFTLEHREFFLYPTFLHEAPGRIQPEAVHEMEDVISKRATEEKVVLSVYARVEAVIRVEDYGRLESLAPYHILSSDEVAKRFRTHDRSGLYVLLLRAFRLPDPHQLPVKEAYNGCRSWVDLGHSLSTEGCRPVLDHRSFQVGLKKIRSRLETVQQ